MAADVLDPPGPGGVAGRSRGEVLAGREALAGAVLSWWESARIERDRLPWRATRDPWAVLVSETMLVQTQAGRVAARYPELLARFPTPSAMARAPLGEVLRAWSGLGYNRRAAWLKAAACQIVDDHAGRVPGGLRALRSLPGVGDYTARAVLAFAFEAPVGVVDTNVGRVLARAVAGERLSAAAAQSLADGLVPAGSSRSWNLALMDLGSLVCTARRPSCARCPLAGGRCAWRRDPGLADPSLGSAATSRPQGAFVGSDRQGRGRLLRAALRAPLPPGELAAAAGWPEDPVRAERVAAALVAEGLLACADDGTLRLP